MSQLAQPVKKYLQTIKSGHKHAAQKHGFELLNQVKRLNNQQGGEKGTEAAYYELSKLVDVDGFMHSLPAAQRRKIQQQINQNMDQKQVRELVGGANDYTLLEVILGVIFFPWSLLYFIFLRTPETRASLAT